MDSFVLSLGIQEINKIFRETKVKKILIRILLRVIPELIEREAKRVLSEDISEEKVK